MKRLLCLFIFPTSLVFAPPHEQTPTGRPSDAVPVSSPNAYQNQKLDDVLREASSQSYRFFNNTSRFTTEDLLGLLRRSQEREAAGLESYGARLRLEYALTDRFRAEMGNLERNTRGLSDSERYQIALNKFRAMGFTEAEVALYKMRFNLQNTLDNNELRRIAENDPDPNRRRIARDVLADRSERRNQETRNNPQGQGQGQGSGQENQNNNNNENPPPTASQKFQQFLGGGGGGMGGGGGGSTESSGEKGKESGSKPAESKSVPTSSSKGPWEMLDKLKPKKDPTLKELRERLGREP